MARNENSSFSYMTRRIGSTTYKVKVVFSDTGKETMEVIRTVSTIQMTVGVEEILGVPLGNSLLQTSE